MTFDVSPKIFTWLAPVLLFTYIWILGSSIRRAREKEESVCFAKALIPKALLTPNEKEFYERLQRAADSLELEVVPQVSMGALLEVNLPSAHPLYWTLRKRFSQKIIDFVLYSKPSLEILAVIELDDKTHNKEKDKIRDEMMAQAGFKTIRWESKAKPSIKQITEVFSSLKQSK